MHTGASGAVVVVLVVAAAVCVFVNAALVVTA